MTSPALPGLSCVNAAGSIGRAVRFTTSGRRASPSIRTGGAGFASPAIAAGTRLRSTNSSMAFQFGTRCGRSARTRRRLPLCGLPEKNCGARWNAGGMRDGMQPAGSCTRATPCWRNIRTTTTRCGTPSSGANGLLGCWTHWNEHRPVIWWRC